MYFEKNNLHTSIFLLSFFLNSFLHADENPILDGKNYCLLSVQKIYDDYFKNYPHLLDFDEEFSEDFSEDPNENINAIFRMRLELREKLAEFSHVLDNPEDLDRCANQSRNLLSSSRYIEDYIGEIYINKIENKIPPSSLEGKSPYLLVNPKFQFSGPKDLRSGDIIMSRGHRFSSATIARATTIPSQFSHISLVYREKNKIFTIESFGNAGVVINEWSEFHAIDGNTREVLMRYKDQKLAAKAARTMFYFIKNYELNNHGKKYPYDFGMDMDDNKEIFCSEVLSEALNMVDPILKGTVPKFRSSIPTDGYYNNLLRRLGVKVTKTFAPGDLDIDPNFSLIAEWRNYSEMKKSRIQDAILTSMMNWIKKRSYIFHSSFFQNIGASIGYAIRHFFFTQKILSHKFPRNMTRSFITTIMAIGKTVNIITKRYDLLETRNKPLPIQKIYPIIEQIREKDLDEYNYCSHEECGQDSDNPDNFIGVFFHHYFRSAII